MKTKIRIWYLIAAKFINNTKPEMSPLRLLKNKDIHIFERKIKIYYAKDYN